jgi:hypothetical protein
MITSQQMLEAGYVLADDDRWYGSRGGLPEPPVQFEIHLKRDGRLYILERWRHDNQTAPRCFAVFETLAEFQQFCIQHDWIGLPGLLGNNAL